MTKKGTFKEADQLTAATELVLDIDRMMKDEKAYLKGGNQYEIGAKIINLCNLMGQVARANNLSFSYATAMNCMSGKDRTGVMDSVARAMHAMYQANRYFPSHKDLKNDDEVKKDFGKYLKQFLLQSGGIEITELNTGAKGYKVTEAANIAGYPLEEFLQFQGLGKTTGS